MSTNALIDSVVKRLLVIARHNNDEFRFSVEIEPRHNGILYRFVVVERTEGHEFVIGVGSSIDEAVRHAEIGIKSACKDWGYKYV